MSNVVPIAALGQPQMVALVKLTTQYGQQAVQPVNDIAKEFAIIAGTKTLTPPTIAAMKRLGYTIAVQQDLPQTL